MELRHDPDHGAPIAPATGKAVCPYCGVGCVLTATVDNGVVTKIAADADQAPNFGMLCAKGVYVKKTLGPETRVTRPLARDSRDEPFREVSWDEAAARVATGLRECREAHGRDSVAFYGSGQLDTEASYLFTKLFKGFLGNNNMDTNSRLCMSSAVAAYVRAFGSDGPPTCYDDIGQADVFLIVGANMDANHPVLFNMVRRRRSTAPHCRYIVVDPRRTQTAALADIHVPIAPGSDVAFLQLVARRLHRRGRVDWDFIKRHTDGFIEYFDHLDRLDESLLLAACDVDESVIDDVVTTIAHPDARLLSFYCMGTNQSTRGVDKNTALINLHLQLGEVGKPGSGPFSLTGQPNAMGGREVGYLSHQLPGHRLVARAEDRSAVEDHWGLESGSIDPAPGLTAVEIFERAARGDVRALWIACTNPAASMPDVKVAQAGLMRADLVVVQDCSLMSETVAYADVVLPAAQWGEKCGTMTNSERLVIRSEKLLEPPGEARPDWWIAARVAREMGFTGFDFERIEEIWDEYRPLTRGTPCDQWGMTNERLQRGPLRWPCPDESHPGTARRYLDGRFATSSGRARFWTTEQQPAAERIDEAFPLVLTTGRIHYQWHTRTKTGLVAELNRREPEPFVEAHPRDAADCALSDGEWVALIGRRGRACARLRVTERVRPGLLFMPFHWGDSFHPRTSANHVTSRALDAVSKQPELKYAAVRLVRAEVADTPDGSRARSADSEDGQNPRSRIASTTRSTAMTYAAGR